MSIDTETNRWGSGRPAIPKGLIYSDAMGRSGYGPKGLLGFVGRTVVPRPFDGLPEAPAVTVGSLHMAFIRKGQGT
jgi:hypothetical protein